MFSLVRLAPITASIVVAVIGTAAAPTNVWSRSSTFHAPTALDLPVSVSPEILPAVYTDLGSRGNLEVVKRFHQYEASGKSCVAKGNGKRVLLTGFGLFSGAAFNISGAVIANLARPSVYPDNVDLLATALSSDSHLHDGVLSRADLGAQVHNRTLLIGNEKYEVCLVIADVMWDLAGAIFALEMERFQPLLVIMTGRGGREAILEGGAQNYATGYPGFAPNGEVRDDNRPISDAILEGAEGTLQLTWNNQKLALAAAPYLASHDVSVLAPSSFRPSNDYICNNVSYIALSAANSRSLALAGGALKLKPRLAQPPQVGFFHMPDHFALNSKDIDVLAKALGAMVQASLTSQIVHD